MPSPNPVITHSNQLTEARYTLTVAEQRLIITLLSFISPQDEDFKDYEIKLADFKVLLNLKSNTVYSNVRDVLRKLQSRVIEIPRTNEIMSWFSYSRYDQKRGTIIIRFDKALKPHLLQLKEQFTKYRLLVVAQFQSYYTIRIYMLLKQYETIGYREFELMEFRQILNISDDKYTMFKEFNRNVIKQAKKEFETFDKKAMGYHSDITFNLITRRTGRKITHLRFEIRKQVHQEALSPIDLPTLQVHQPSQAEQLLNQYGIKGRWAEKYLNEQEDEDIIRCIDLLHKAKQGKEIINESAYLKKLLDEQAGKLTKAEKAAQQEYDDSIQLVQTQYEVQVQKQKREQFSREFFLQEREVYLDTLSLEEQEQLLKRIRLDATDGDLIKDLYSPFARRELKFYIPNYFEREEEYMRVRLREATL